MLHNRERFYLATLQASLQYPIRRVATPSLATGSLWSAKNGSMQNGSRQLGGGITDAFRRIFSAPLTHAPKRLLFAAATGVSGRPDGSPAMLPLSLLAP